MKHAILCIALVALVGCETTPKLPEVVKVPIAIPCPVATPTPPDYKFGTLTENDSIWTKVKTLLADRQLSVAYEEELKTALAACK